LQHARGITPRAIKGLNPKTEVALQATNLGVGAFAASKLLRKPKNNGANMNNPQSMVAKSYGNISKNGHGKSLDEKKSKLPGASAAVGGTIGAGAGGYLGHMYGDGGLERVLTGEKRTKKVKPDHTPMPNHEKISGSSKVNREYEQMMRTEGMMGQKAKKVSSLSRTKHFAGRNKWAIGGGAAIGASGALNGYLEGKKAVSKSEKSRRYASNAVIGAGTAGTAAGAGLAGYGYHLIRTSDKEKNALSNLARTASGVTSTQMGLRTAAVGGGVAGAGLGLRAHNKKKGKHEVKKAHRRFDPEADRQRRAGLYTGLGVLGAGIAAERAIPNFTTSAVDNAGNPVRGIFARSAKKGKIGLGLGAASLASGAFAAKTYKHGLSSRNQPWT
jgi:hypothetical protein